MRVFVYALLLPGLVYALEGEPLVDCVMHLRTSPAAVPDHEGPRAHPFAGAGDVAMLGRSASAGKLEVALFSRGAHAGYHSMEKVFQAIERELPEHIRARAVRCPVHGQGLWRRLVCLAYITARRAPVNHIVGDITFAALALPGDRTIVTVHDFGRLQSLSGWRAGLFRLLYFEAPFRHCRFVTVISGQVAKELADLLPWASSKVRVIPDCLPDGFRHIPKSFNSTRPRILQIGTKPNKNLENLASALVGECCELDIVGRLSAAQKSHLERCGVPYRNSVDVPEGELLDAYARADIVAFVSTYEGFGLPILEGNAVGRPVLTSDLPPMSDVAGEAACRVDPHNVDSIRGGLKRIITDADYRQDLIARGLENVSRYSSAEIARQFAALYEEVAWGRSSNVVAKTQ
jgi:glycosyltransferase involved in cell wall biosynthesis